MSSQNKRKKTHTPLSQLIQHSIDHHHFFYSFEFSPARDPNPQDLYARIARMTELQPLWVDVTWGFGDIGQRSIDAARYIQKHLDIPCLLHFIATDKTTEQLEQSLRSARAAGVRSILALRGYTQAGYDTWQPCDDGDGSEPQHADALVRFIKERHQDWFSIGVAGFPEGHPESNGDLHADVMHLKGKIEAGGEFVICQFCFDVQVFIAFVQRCRNIGITVPILPGIMPLTEYSTARLLSDVWKVSLPVQIESRLQACEEKGRVEQGRKCGETFVVNLCEQLLEELEKAGEADGGRSWGSGLHFFVYDAEYEVRQILKRLAKRNATLLPGVRIEIKSKKNL